VALVLAVACGHTVFQFRPSGAQASALDAAVQRFVAASQTKNGALVADDVDLEGRKAFFELTLHFAQTQTRAGRELVALAGLFAMIVIPLAYVGGTDTPLLDILYDRARDLAVAMEAELGPLLPETADAGTGTKLGDLATAVAARQNEASRTHVERLVASGFADELHECAASRLVSYHASLLNHLDSEPSGHTYLAWKEHVRAAHLYVVRCRERDGVVLFDDYDDRPRPGLVGWRFFTHDEWARLEPRVRRALAL
jgi:hypothetical protein